MSNKFKVIITPLNWGLGHATRCVPVIKWFNDAGWEVHLAGNGLSLQFLEQEFPGLASYTLPGIEINYKTIFPLPIHLARQWRSMKRAIQLEHEAIAALVQSIKPRLIISDNRYGCHSDEVFSVLVSHQIQLPIKYLRGLLSPISARWINARLKNFDHILIPDFEDEDQRLSGKLSDIRNISNPVSFTGPLSRFSAADNNPQALKKYKYCAILSGPEPSRSVLEKKLFSILNKLNESSVIIGGNLRGATNNTFGNVTLFDYLKSDELLNTINNSEYLIARGGYSTIMDFYCLGRQALLVPTRGQWEQEYLANHLKHHPLFCFNKQPKLEVQHGIRQLTESSSQITMKNTTEMMSGSLRHMCSLAT